ncbi:MAG: dNTP triphosphohydrolase [Candidatus Peribacteraceae bacterium]|nr:dNTP triphosphohydrolase [Candidatus Peribacteraceae bacterium]MDD5739932.1 dNTP triphosphohydrolase [Candidatus Peribacteraceae bacterium]
MLPLKERLQQANTLLAPYAVPHQGTLGRTVKEPEDETRFPFQRDRDRIIHTQAFRRLKGKTQVFVAGGSDHVRTRLTHTMEVAQISRDIARTLGLNEDLAECIALAHDLGHPPFGHAGEEALNAFMEQHGEHFEHNEQSLRIVTVLEEHSKLTPGLNLDREILEGLQKHSTPFDTSTTTNEIIARRQALPAWSASSQGKDGSWKENLRFSFHALLEAQVVNLADEIAYTAHDCDDGIGSQMFAFAEITAIPLAKKAADRAAARGTKLRGALIHLLVSDLYAATEQELDTHAIRTLREVAAVPGPLVRFSPAMDLDLQALHDFLWQRLYLHPHVLACNAYGQSIVTALCRQYASHPSDKILALMQKNSSLLPEAVKDYVSGMTDAFALKQAQELKLTAALGAAPAAPEEP